MLVTKPHFDPRTYRMEEETRPQEGVLWSLLMWALACVLSPLLTHIYTLNNKKNKRMRIIFLKKKETGPSTSTF